MLRRLGVCLAASVTVVCACYQVSDMLVSLPRNIGTQVWLVPVPAGDMQQLARRPELWPKASRRVDVFSFYQLHATDYPGFRCGTPCGPNTYEAFHDTVHGGMIHWLSERFDLAVEVVSVKDYTCTDRLIREVAASGVNMMINNIESAGGRVTYLSLDEPFTSGTASHDAPVTGGCGLSVSQVARLQRSFNETVLAEHPDVRIGLIEPYPHFSPEDIEALVSELDRAGVSLSFFHLDVDLRAVTDWQHDFGGDVMRIREFFRRRGTPFGVIIIGTDGSSNERFAAGAWAMTRLIAVSIGITEHTVFQSWAESVPGNQNSPKIFPDTVPEAYPFSHSGQLLGMLMYLGVSPTKEE